MQFARPQASGFGRKVLGASAVIATSATALALLAGPASAHTPNVDAKCADGKVKIKIDLGAYNDKGGNKGNFVVVTEGDKKVHEKEFGGSYKPGWIDTDLDPAVKHTITFAVDAHDGKHGTEYDKTFEKTTEACAKPTTPSSTTTTTTTPVTTTEVSETTSPSSEVPPVETTPSTTESAPTSTSPVSVAPTTTTTSVAVVPVNDEDELASTGASILVPLLAGIGLLGAGAGALFFVRRRNTA